MVPDGELLNEREDVEVVWKLVLLKFFLLLFLGLRHRDFSVQELQIRPDLQLGDQVRLLEIIAEVAILGNVSQQL